jgi:hypothetical protein
LSVSTAFSDLTQEEFSKGYLGSKRDGKTYAKNILDEVPTASGAAGSVDWSGKYTVRAVHVTRLL